MGMDERTLDALRRVQTALVALRLPQDPIERLTVAETALATLGELDPSLSTDRLPPATESDELEA